MASEVLGGGSMWSVPYMISKSDVVEADRQGHPPLSATMLAKSFEVVSGQVGAIAIAVAQVGHQYA